MAKIKNSLNYDYTQNTGQMFTQPSQTIPDQTMSIKTIMERYAKGLPIANGLAPIYEDDDVPSNGINPRTLDLVDIQELRLKNEEDVEYYNNLVSRKSKKQPKNNAETSEDEQSTNNP